MNIQLKGRVLIAFLYVRTAKRCHYAHASTERRATITTPLSNESGLIRFTVDDRSAADVELR